MAIAHRPRADRILLYTDWEGYERFLAAIGDGHTKATYDRGTLELMTPGERHETVKSMLRRLLEALMDERRVLHDNGGSMTFKRKDLDKGFEPDECYWIANAERVGNPGRDYDPLIDPPPDLAIEVEVTRSLIDRIGIYEAMRVPEIWRWNDRRGKLRIHHRTADGDYEDLDYSPTFPDLPLAVFEEFAKLGIKTLTSQAVWAFQDWLRSR
ncbi:MAG: Uma2 family endonuclease [Candidatus Xenobia bacterium]